jgi:hypothetical protein
LIVINILVPVFLPYLIIAIIAVESIGAAPAAGTPPLWRVMLRKSVDSGQLFWTSISLLAAMSYDTILAWEKHPNQRSAIGWTLGGCVFLGLSCTLLAGLTTLRSAQGGVANPITIRISIGLTLLLSLFFPLAHFSFA